MPKLKTHRGAAKRFRVTGSGRVKRSKAYAQHILTKKSRKRKRKFRKSVMVHPSDYKRVVKMLPMRGLS